MQFLLSALGAVVIMHDNGCVVPAALHSAEVIREDLSTSCLRSPQWLGVTWLFLGPRAVDLSLRCPFFSSFDVDTDSFAVRRLWWCTLVPELCHKELGIPSPALRRRSRVDTVSQTRPIFLGTVSRPLSPHSWMCHLYMGT
ncbi:hypothetical protein CALCODRAFT_152438 [Calocera cornea HHB12733]|uniref:Uncharacterized protein n=1 Tax=Calocera cornea HHB12733 TaxID=1353952 RepID=A0A165CN86_9BASI|nr:hypothetical protein CALCODRAFT_152438 [Calocera cornea HHB12733]